MENKRQKLINRIKGFSYYDNMDVAWCKAIDLRELISMQYISTEEERKRLNNALETIDRLDSRLEIRTNFIEHLYYWLPEDSPYGAFQDADWLLDEKNACRDIVNKMIVDSSRFISALHKYNIERLTGILLREGIHDIYASMENPTAKEKIDRYLTSRNCDIEGRSFSGFEDYQVLGKLFLDELFDLEQVQFFIMKYSDDLETFPAIIGIDNQTIGMLWIDN